MLKNTLNKNKQQTQQKTSAPKTQPISTKQQVQSSIKAIPSIKTIDKQEEEPNSMQVQFCSKKDHYQNPLNLVCLEENCEHKGLVCSFCLIESHSYHVQKCVPLKRVFQALNKINNPKTKEELGFIGCDILKQHNYLLSQFRRYIFAIQDSIKSLEQAIEKIMFDLQQESQLFVGNLLEKSLNKLNDPAVTAKTIQEELKKLFPLLQISAVGGQIECLGIDQKQREAERVTKSAELLERECRYWMEKSLDDLQKLENNIIVATRRKPIFKLSDSRFGVCHNGWNFGETEGISFKINKDKDIWLNGFGMYEITKWPKDQTRDRDNSGEFSIEINIYQGGTTQGKNIHSEIIMLTKGMEVDQNHIMQLTFSKAIKLETKQTYTITMKPNKESIGYYGFNGSYETDDFQFQDTIFSKGIQSNSTCIMSGQFPVFYFEE